VHVICAGQLALPTPAPKPCTSCETAAKWRQAKQAPGTLHAHQQQCPTWQVQHPTATAAQLAGATEAEADAGEGMEVSAPDEAGARRDPGPADKKRARRSRSTSPTPSPTQSGHLAASSGAGAATLNPLDSSAPHPTEKIDPQYVAQLIQALVLQEQVTSAKTNISVCKACALKSHDMPGARTCTYIFLSVHVHACTFIHIC
jgi:hypothetical protein